MARPRSQHPTELELQIIKVIWRDGPSNVRHVRDELQAWRELAYTSVMTIMNIMADKGYLRRVKEGPSFTYHARVTERNTTRKMLKDVVDRAFDGSVTAAIETMLDAAELDAEERQLLRDLVHRKLQASAVPAIGRPATGGLTRSSFPTSIANVTGSTARTETPGRT